MTAPNPSHIMQIGMGFFASKTLLSAVELGLFTALARHRMTAAEIAASLGLSARAVPDLPDALVALKLLEREGDGAAVSGEEELTLLGESEAALLVFDLA